MANDSPTQDEQLTAEHKRLQESRERKVNWKRWGPYLAERQWGTVREDYSAYGHAWWHFPHDHSRNRVYRWGEDGLLGLTDRECRLCFSFALWNGNDSILKERLFGLTGPEGNHGEDVKEYYYYQDSTPTHSYMKAMYRYPQAAYPYVELVTENRKRSLEEREYELLDTGIFNENRFFDVEIEYAKQTEDDILIRLTITNQGPEAHDITVLPTFWFRNTWIWGCRHEGCSLKPRIREIDENTVETNHESLEPFRCSFGPNPQGKPRPILFTENETNNPSLYGTESYTPYMKDAFHRYVVNGEKEKVNPAKKGTKAAGLYELNIKSGESVTIEVRMTEMDAVSPEPFGPEFDSVMSQRIAESNEFYQSIIPQTATADQTDVMRQAYSGLLWSKQFYHYIVEDWLNGDTLVNSPPEPRKEGRNHNWKHVYARDIISMPDTWEYPWFAAWDLAFHMIPMAKLDPDFAKRQLMLLMREWYMHPNGQLPAYEYAFYDVNPPVHAWACLRVFQMTGSKDFRFLSKAFQRLLLNFTWWVNQIDKNGDNVFAGGFLGLDNIGVFDRTKGLPKGAFLEQADGTSWMAFYCGTMLMIALELARNDDSYAEMASKFLDHFVRITDAMNSLDGSGLWDEEDHFYYDHLRIDGQNMPLKVRSLVGLLPLIAVVILDEAQIDKLPSFRRKLDWFLKYRHDLVKHITFAESDDDSSRMLLSIPSEERLKHVISVLLDETEFLSEYGIRSLSKRHKEEPFELEIQGIKHCVAYIPGESDSWMFGGNSNWRGPIWFPINYILIESLRHYYEFYENDLMVECPTGSGNLMNLNQVADELMNRLSKLFLMDDKEKHRPSMISHANGIDPALWQQNVLFYEYFHGDTGEGLGASHQTGWTSLIATCMEMLNREPPETD
ncbi:glucosidase [uncultured Rubinisphaera sp.]|uniref:MGH1-like glycoside hydrolase domain-containing protein n=1 Tax=uncultured Rubinisphaera sp. TaxID=1678686 RepID=UPI0030DBD97A